MFDRLKNFVLSRFAKSVPLIIKTSGGGGVFGGRPIFIWGKGLLRTSKDSSAGVLGPKPITIMVVGYLC